MDCKANIEKIAASKLESAKCLVKNGFLNEAYYLAGYSVELYLKAMVCKTLGIDTFFQFDGNKAKQEFYKTFKVHRYSDLLLLSGIYSNFEKEQGNASFKAEFSIVNQWSEGERYSFGKTETEVGTFIKSVENFCLWIQKHL